jgi:hypothetical protein
MPTPTYREVMDGLRQDLVRIIDDRDDELIKRIRDEIDEEGAMDDYEF